MKSIFSKIHRFEDMEFIQGEQFTFTLNSNKSDNSVKQESVSSKFENNKLYRITVKKYMTQKSNRDFDFMYKWNNDIPMPFVRMTAKVIKQTRGMIYAECFGDIEKTDICMKCGKPLTNPVSRLYGLGPECGQHAYINPFDTEDELREHLEEVKTKIQNIKWTGWIIKSAIKDCEDITDE
nr:MAG TPA: adenylate kinase [Caudoviricetes sp.]